MGTKTFHNETRFYLLYYLGYSKINKEGEGMRYRKETKVKLETGNYYVVIDFDKTITTLESTDSWEATGKSLGETFNQKMTQLYQTYRPVELNYQITFEEKKEAMETWYQECMDLYYEYHLTEKKLKESIQASNFIVREGAKEFLNDLYEKQVPVIILSAGIGNTIELFLKENGCYHENIFIISNFIAFDKKQNMIKFNHKMIHSLNKTMVGHLPRNLAKKLEEKPYRLLLGDAIEDKKMIEENEWKKSICVGFLNEKIEENLAIYQKNFDVVLTKEDATFEVVKKIVF